MHGILPLWKPKGMTSHDCVREIRKIYGTKKVGHTGTLDPEVEGVLGICIGNATKVSQYLTAMKKTYLAECALGKSTDTEDAQGEIIEEVIVSNPPSKAEIDKVLESFRGEIKQIPPMYSAVRVNGKRLYEYARANEEVERPERTVTVYELINLLEDAGKTDRFDMKIVCSEGTYIRTLCVDIGKQLGYPAHMSNLSRIEACSFKANETVTFAEILEAKEANKEKELLTPIARALNFMDRLDIDEETKQKVLHGQKLAKPERTLKTNPFLIMNDEELVALYQIDPKQSDQIKPVRVFNW